MFPTSNCSLWLHSALTKNVTKVFKRPQKTLDIPKKCGDTETTYHKHLIQICSHSSVFIHQYLWQERLKDVGEVIESCPCLVDHVQAHCS